MLCSSDRSLGSPEPVFPRGRRVPGQHLTPPTTSTTPSVAVDADGDFVVAWTSAGQDGTAYGVFAARFNSAGAPQGAEFQVNTYTTSIQQRPVGGRRERRRLRRRLAELRPGRPTATASSRGASTPPARRWPPSSRSTPTPPSDQCARRASPRTATATSSSPGRADGQDGCRRRHLRAALQLRRARRWPSSSRSTPSPAASSSQPRGRDRRRRRLRRRLGRATTRTAAATASSPSASTPPGARQGAEFQVNTYTTGQPVPADGRGGRRRRLRRRLAEPRPGRSTATRHLRPALHAAGVAQAHRVPGQHLHHRVPALSARSPPTPTATSSSPGRAATRTAPTRRLRPALQRAADRRSAASSRSTPTPRTARATRPSTGDSDGDFVIAWQASGPGRQRATASSPSASAAAARHPRHRRQRACSPAHRRAARPALPVRLHRHLAHQRRRRRQLHALRRHLDHQLPHRARPDARHRRQRRTSTRSPTACSSCASCSGSPERRSPTARWPATADALRRGDDRAVSADSRLTDLGSTARQVPHST